MPPRAATGRPAPRPHASRRPAARTSQPAKGRAAPQPPPQAQRVDISGLAERPSPAASSSTKVTTDATGCTSASSEPIHVDAAVLARRAAALARAAAQQAVRRHAALRLLLIRPAFVELRRWHREHRRLQAAFCRLAHTRTAQPLRLWAEQAATAVRHSHLAVCHQCACLLRRWRRWRSRRRLARRAGALAVARCARVRRGRALARWCDAVLLPLLRLRAAAEEGQRHRLRRGGGAAAAAAAPLLPLPSLPCTHHLHRHPDLLLQATPHGRCSRADAAPVPRGGGGSRCGGCAARGACGRRFG